MVSRIYSNGAFVSSYVFEMSFPFLFETFARRVFSGAIEIHRTSSRLTGWLDHCGFGKPHVWQVAGEVDGGSQKIELLTTSSIMGRASQISTCIPPIQLLKAIRSRISRESLRFGPVGAYPKKRKSFAVGAIRREDDLTLRPSNCLWFSPEA